MARIVHILLCEDRDDDARELGGLIARYEGKRPCALQVTRAPSVAEALACLQARRYGLILLDVFVGKSNALAELGRVAKYSSAEIVVVTSSSDHALMAFGIDAMGYLVKPVTYPELEHVLDRAFQRIGQASEAIVLKSRGKAMRLDYAQIVYCETRNHRQRIVLADGRVEQVYLSGAEMYAQLADIPAFLRVGASFIVNLDHVRQLESRKALMDDGSVIPIPRDRVVEVRDAYFAHWRRKALG